MEPMETSQVIIIRGTNVKHHGTGLLVQLISKNPLNGIFAGILEQKKSLFV